MNLEFSQEQVKAMAERAVTVLATIFLAKLVKWGWLSDSDSAALLPFVVIMPSLAYAWWINRNKALVIAAANTVDDQGRKPVIVTSQNVANSTAETNIVSAENVKVVNQAGIEITRPA